MNTDFEMRSGQTPCCDANKIFIHFADVESILVQCFIMCTSATTWPVTKFEASKCLCEAIVFDKESEKAQCYVVQEFCSVTTAGKHMRT